MKRTPVWAKKQIAYDPSTITIDSFRHLAKEACYSSVIQSIVLGWNFSHVVSNSRRIYNLYFPSSTTTTMTVARTSQVLEEGDIFFFYRPRVGTEEVDDIEDIQRFYMITAPEDGRYRLFIVGQKRLPEIVEGKSTSEERNWALNILTTDNPEDIRKEFLPAEYETETRGRRRLAAAIPAGEGKYAIVKHDNHTELAYVLELPKVPGLGLGTIVQKVPFHRCMRLLRDLAVRDEPTAQALVLLRASTLVRALAALVPAFGLVTTRHWVPFQRSMSVL